MFRHQFSQTAIVQFDKVPACQLHEQAEETANIYPSVIVRGADFCIKEIPNKSTR
jgi:hypothetical protein